jgi:CRISPR/Cas system CSM-associated protein Csm3 (group 7 of RAMP superfamily)
MNQYTLIVDVHDWWQPGTGLGSGAHLDELAHVDADGLPELPGRTLKGLLRDAVTRAEELGWVEKGITERLFGRRDDTDDGRTSPGCLRVGSARLPEAERRWLALAEAEDARAQLFSEISATAIDRQSGSAVEHSLRGIQVVLPLTISAPIGLVPGRDAPAGWQKALRLSLPLIRAVGSGRSRGLGRATLTLENAE